jgi:hypothetical protein
MSCYRYLAQVYDTGIFIADLNVKVPAYFRMEINRNYDHDDIRGDFENDFYHSI